MVKPLSVLWAKADDVLVDFHIVPLLIFSAVEIGAHTGNGKVTAAAVQNEQAAALPENHTAGFIKDGFVGKRGMIKQEILLGGSAVRILRA